MIGVTHAGAPCPHCVAWMDAHYSRDDHEILEMIQPMPRTPAPERADGSGPCCYDCQSADNTLKIVHREGAACISKTVWASGLRDMSVSSGITWSMVRLAVGNDRREQYRLPGAPIGLARRGTIRMSEHGDLEAHYAWIESLDMFDVSAS